MGFGYSLGQTIGHVSEQMLGYVNEILAKWQDKRFKKCVLDWSLDADVARRLAERDVAEFPEAQRVFPMDPVTYQPWG